MTGSVVPQKVPPAAPLGVADAGERFRVQVEVLTGDPAGSRADGTVRCLGQTVLTARSGLPVLFLAAGQPVETEDPDGGARPQWTGTKVQVVPVAYQNGTILVDVHVTHREPRAGAAGVAEEFNRLSRIAEPGAAFRVRVSAVPGAPRWVEVTVGGPAGQ